jgi:hypothetical protein
MSKNIVNNYIHIHILQKRKRRVLKKLKNLQDKMAKIDLSYDRIDSDIAQEIGYQNSEIYLQKEKLFKKETILETKRYNLKNIIQEIDKKIYKIEHEIEILNV